MAVDATPSINPSQERLYSKITDLEQTLSVVKSGNLDPTQLKVAQACDKYIAMCWNYLGGRRKHSHLVWEFLHRVDENMILLLPDAFDHGVLRVACLCHVIFSICYWPMLLL